MISLPVLGHPQPGRGDGWFGFDAVRQLVGLPPVVLLIMLAGHSCGHSAVAVFEENALGGPR
jgi:hypothetical protein